MGTNPLAQSLERLHAELSRLDHGEVATYIPELGRANPDHFGICIATVDGHVYSVGDSGVPFTIQSISKPFVYALALEDLGVEKVLQSVGVEPSGDAFNAISLEPGTGRPRNPMINAGAIATAGLIEGKDGMAPFERIHVLFSELAGRSLEIDEAVFRSERETGHRNRAIGHLLKNADIVEGSVDAVCDLYFRQCSVMVTSEDLALMGATLAAGGINPRTGRAVLSADSVQRVLSVMSSCGMYDYSGSWVYRVGLPAKSGVGGGIVAVLPGQLGIGVFSPKLDALGNSVRGRAVCERLSSSFGLHVLQPPLAMESVVRRVARLSEIGSRRQRTTAEAACLEQAGRSVPVIQLQGPLVFSTAEIVLREALAQGSGATILFDLSRVTQVDAPVAALFGELAQQTRSQGGLCVFGGSRPDHTGASTLAAALAAGDGQGTYFEDIGQALEWCEDRVLARAGVAVETETELALDQHPIAQALTGADAAALGEVVDRREAREGEVIIRRGDPATALYLLVRGLVGVLVGGANGRAHRVATLGPGAVFGELALLDAGSRSADVIAVTGAVYYELPLEAIDALDGERAGFRPRIVQILARDLAARLRRANAAMEVLSR